MSGALGRRRPSGFPRGPWSPMGPEQVLGETRALIWIFCAFLFFILKMHYLYNEKIDMI